MLRICIQGPEGEGRAASKEVREGTKHVEVRKSLKIQRVSMKTQKHQMKVKSKSQDFGVK